MVDDDEPTVHRQASGGRAEKRASSGPPALPPLTFGTAPPRLWAVGGASGHRLPSGLAASALRCDKPQSARLPSLCSAVPTEGSGAEDARSALTRPAAEAAPPSEGHRGARWWTSCRAERPFTGVVRPRRTRSGPSRANDCDELRPPDVLDVAPGAAGCQRATTASPPRLPRGNYHPATERQLSSSHMPGLIGAVKRNTRSERWTQSAAKHVRPRGETS